MTTTDPKTPGHDPLDDFFAAARATAPALGDDLRARILADADAVLTTARAPAPAPRPSLWARVGGWVSGSVAGGLTAAAAGFWFGVATPLPVAALDLPVWVDGALGVFDTVTGPLLGVDDAYLAGF